MTARRTVKKPPSVRTDDDRVYVVDDQGSRPFMRGIMVHALTARGIPFEAAYRTADRVRRRREWNA